MNPFQIKITELKHKLSQGLPGENAQYRMAPKIRLSKNDYLSKDPEYRKSSVLILLYPVNGLPNLVLTERTKYPGTHSGQISFPGGKYEPGDLDLSHTALRETEEEIGVKGSGIDIIGSLTDLYIPPSRFLVFPYVGYTGITPVFRKEPKEVESILEVPLTTLSDSTIQKKKMIKLATGAKIETPYFDIMGKTVWGATAMILSEFLEIWNRKTII